MKSKNMHIKNKKLVKVNEFKLGKRIKYFFNYVSSKSNISFPAVVYGVDLCTKIE